MINKIIFSEKCNFMPVQYKIAYRFNSANYNYAAYTLMNEYL